MIMHWLRYTRIYRIYYWMCNRCYNKKGKDYYRYWGKWITCERKGFLEFYNDMNKSYLEHCKKYWEKNTTIDRIDNAWNYCKENCRWATILEQNNNRYCISNIEYEWVIYSSIADMCRKLWIYNNYRNIRNRIRNLWWSISDAIKK